MGTWPFNVYPEDKDFFEEWNYKPKENEPAQPSGRMTAARVTGRLARGLVREPFEWGGEVMDRAYQGKATMQDAIGATLMAMPPMRGGGLGAGPRVKAMPWQSRTLDAILGESPVGKKFPDAANPQTWLSKLKGAGLPKEEVGVVENFLGAADPRSKLTRQQLGAAVDETVQRETYLTARKELSSIRGENSTERGNELRQVMSNAATETQRLPSLGITKTVLGGEEWVAGQKRLDEIPGLTANLREKSQERIREMYKETGGAVPAEVYKADPKYMAIVDERKALSNEQMQLAQDAVGKRPHWPQYQLEGVENPREILYHGKSPSGESYTAPKADSHWGGKGENLAWHQFEGDLKMPEGKMSTHISGQQSEWIAEHAKYSKNAGDGVLVLEQMTGDVAPVAKLKDLVVIKNSDGYFEVNNKLDGTNYDLFTTEKAAHDWIKENSGAIPTIPEPPMKENWYKAGLKDSVNRAVEAGHDYLSWDTAETMSKRWPDPNEKTHKFFQEHYDQKMGKFLAKEYGVKVERINITPQSPPQYKVTWANQVEDINGAADTRTHMEQFSTRSQAQYFLDHFDEATRGLDRGQNIRIQPSIYEVPIKDSKDVWRIPITEEMKRKVLLEGQYWSKKDQVAKPGGKDAQMAA